MFHAVAAHRGAEDLFSDKELHDAKRDYAFGQHS